MRLHTKWNYLQALFSLDNLLYALWIHLLTRATIINGANKWTDPFLSGVVFTPSISDATVLEQTSPSRLVTMATGVASAGLSRCFNGACWWMTPLLYHSMLCHLQLHAAPACSPPHPRMSSYCFHWRKWICSKNNKQTKKISPAEILPSDKRSAWLQQAAGRWGKCCWPQWRQILLEMASPWRWGSGAQKPGWKEVRHAALSSDWIAKAEQQWGVKKGEQNQPR